MPAASCACFIFSWMVQVVCSLCRAAAWTDKS
jgi:hypothetical protein